jgi:hypothetical protein
MVDATQGGISDQLNLENGTSQGGNKYPLGALVATGIQRMGRVDVD